MVVVAIVIIAILPTDTATAWFFTEAGREYAAWMLGQDASVTQRTLSETQETLEEKRDFKVAGSSSSVDTEEFEWREIWRGALDIQTWLTGASLFLYMATVYEREHIAFQCRLGRLSLWGSDIQVSRLHCILCSYIFRL
ncbi:hypothetical protein M378DRAFT_161411 [Amanita muscaria Koide BX008]|uniref:Uncharacterized protein n=1 Tax=Amanita muscaria (strain Koide BX008) TaxID=946122 RepID=A0A0C2WWF9_AMAMK|nr:hypothetical protein M378DRAFT_161411 [Amanita muscaria Koide BX008]